MARPEDIRILSIRALSPAQLAMIRAAVPGAIVTSVGAATAPEIEAALTPDIEVLLAGQGNFSIKQARALKWVQAENAGVDHFYDTEVWHSAATLTSANGAHTPHMAEYVLSVMLSRAYNLQLAQDYQSRHEWGGGEQRARFTPHELHGQTLGIVGYGAIGREVARLATAFGMRVLATKRTAASAIRYDGYTLPGTGDPEGVLPAAFFALDQPGQLKLLLNQSDSVVLLVPLTGATRHIIGATELAHLKPTALLINIGRGGLIDQPALIDALKRHTLGGAVLDVTDPEPLPQDNALWDMPNVVITPHTAGLSTHYHDNVVRVFSANLKRYVNGEGLLNVVRRDLGY